MTPTEKRLLVILGKLVFYMGTFLLSTKVLEFDKSFFEGLGELRDATEKVEFS